MSKGSAGEMACRRPTVLSGRGLTLTLTWPVSVYVCLCSGAAGAQGHGLDVGGSWPAQEEGAGPQRPLQAVPQRMGHEEPQGGCWGVGLSW